MKGIIGAAAPALVMALPALASAQVFPTCQDASNYGYNAAHLYVGQAFARMRCNPAQLQQTNATLVGAVENMQPTFIDTDAMRLCYYDGFYSGVIDRLEYEYGQCDSTSGFPALTFEPVSRYAIAVLSSMTRSVRRSLSAANLDQVFSRDYGPLERSYCVRALESAELEILGAAGVRMHARTLNMLETEICG